ncbi:MAG: hypothetical protein V4459_10590, partial [Pseudomonadota bacterium]
MATDLHTLTAPVFIRALTALDDDEEELPEVEHDAGDTYWLQNSLPLWKLLPKDRRPGFEAAALAWRA